MVYEDEYVRLAIGLVLKDHHKGFTVTVISWSPCKTKYHHSPGRGWQGVITRGSWGIGCNGHNDAIFSLFLFHGLCNHGQWHIMTKRLEPSFESDMQGPLQDEYWDPTTSNDGSYVGTSSHDESQNPTNCFEPLLQLDLA